MGIFNPGRGTAAATGLVLAVTFGVAALLGRLSGPEPTPPEPAPAEPAPAELATPEPGPGPGPRSAPSPGTAPARAQPPDRSPGPRAASARRPAAGDLPLRHSGSGPHGSHRTTGERYVALTFDDGPDPRWTPQVLEVLREHEIRATFCVVGQLVEAHPELVREIAGDGHTLCNHTWSHDLALGSRSRAEIRDDLERTTAAIRTAAPGARVSYYRQPGGAWTGRVVRVAEELGMSSLHWAVDPQDWRRPGRGAIASEVTAATGPGAIVLLHDGGGERNGTVRALRTVLPDLAGRLRLGALPADVDPVRRRGPANVDPE